MLLEQREKLGWRTDGEVPLLLSASTLLARSLPSGDSARSLGGSFCLPAICVVHQELSRLGDILTCVQDSQTQYVCLLNTFVASVGFNCVRLLLQFIFLHHVRLIFVS